MQKAHDLSSLVYNNLKVIRFSIVKNKNAHWICQCLLCGNETEVSRPNILSGNTKDCGCKRSEKLSVNSIKHGHSGSPTWVSWSKLRQRIITKKNKTYASIDYDKRWEDFEVFLQDMGERPEGCSIDRIDNTKGYYKENCRWATQREQCRNKSNNVNLTLNGLTMCATDWSDYLGIHRDTIRRRLRRGLSVEEVLRK
jgi:hypothetical protein